MTRFRDVSIRRKLMVIIMMTTVVALVLASAAFFAYDVVSFRRTMADNLAGLAETLGAASAIPMVFNDAPQANGILAGLSALPHVVSAEVWKEDQEAVFAEYRRAGAELPTGVALPASGGERFSGGFLTVDRPVRFGDRDAGFIRITSNLEELQARLRDYLLILGLILAGTTLIALAMSSAVQRVVSQPILRLLRVEKRVSREKNFALRAEKQGQDEIGELIDGFNEVLAEVQARDQELSVARDRAEQANRSKSAFLANMSHELRTPLTAIIGYSEILEDDAKELGVEDFLPDLRKIQAAGKHLLGLINSILDLSKVEAGKMELHVEPFDVRKLCEEVTATVMPLLDKNGNRLEVRSAPDLGTLTGDLTKTRQVLYNLLSNASKFTQEGTVTLTAERRRDNGEDWFVFRVRDTGIGMSEEQMGKLFQPFTQADSSTARHFGGTGLGLALCKHFSEAMGGRIRVASEPGKGSTFTLYLPAVVDPERQKAAAPAPRAIVESGSWPRSESGKIRLDRQVADGRLVLVVDDDPAVHELLTDLLHREGFRVATASDGEEGLARARELSPDIITLDVNMPRRDGWSVLTEIKSDAQLADTPVIMLSVSDQKEKGYALGASEFLTKPIDRKRLAALLVRYDGTDGRAPSALVIDDDPAVRELLVKMIGELGWEVREAENGLVGLRRVADQVPAVILLDLMMPQMDGFAFLQQLRKNVEWRRIPVVVVTAKELDAEDRQRLNGGVERVLQKGAFSLEELKAEVRALARGSLQRVTSA